MFLLILNVFQCIQFVEKVFACKLVIHSHLLKFIFTRLSLQIDDFIAGFDYFRILFSFFWLSLGCSYFQPETKYVFANWIFVLYITNFEQFFGRIQTCFLVSVGGFCACIITWEFLRFKSTRISTEIRSHFLSTFHLRSSNLSHL